MSEPTDAEHDRGYDPRNPAHLGWWMDKVRQRVETAMDLPDGLTLAWDPPVLPRRCESEACDEYDGIHCYGDGCAMVRRQP